MNDTAQAAVTAASARARRWRWYPAYEPAGFQWLAEMPEGWKATRLKYLASVRPSNIDKKSVEGQVDVRLCNYVDVYNRDCITSDLELMRATATRAQISAFALRAGDVVVTKDSETWKDIAVPAYVPGDLADVVCGYHLAVVRPRPEKLLGRYLFWALSSGAINHQFAIAANGITRFGLSTSAISSAWLPTPSNEAQRAIASFLDRETARIDALVGKKRRLVELLHEKRAAIITRAVTRGLDPSTPMKDSGVEWLGEVPAHWSPTRLMFLTQPRRAIMYGIVLPGPNVPDGVPIVKGGDVAPGRLRLDLLSRTTCEIEARYERSRLRPRDIVYAIRGSIGMAELVPDELDGANLTQDAARIAPRTDVNRCWLLYAVRSAPVFAQLDARATGATIRGVNIKDLKRAVVPVPPPAEQEAIASHLDRESTRIDALVTKLEQSIALLDEHRQALITAAVTGQIDARGEVPS